MAEKQDKKELTLEEVNAKFNAQNIQNLTYKEIIELNRLKNKGTFMDRTWRENQVNILEDESLSKWDKFKAGGYNIGNLTNRYGKRLSLQQQKLDFIQNMIAQKQNFEDDRDKLILRKMEIKILNQFNLYRIPFMMGMVALSLSIYFRSKKPFGLRVIPILFIGSFTSLFNYHVGMYGLFKNIDQFLEILQDKKGSEVEKRTSAFVEELKIKHDNYQKTLREKRDSK